MIGVLTGGAEDDRHPPFRSAHRQLNSVDDRVATGHAAAVDVDQDRLHPRIMQIKTNYSDLDSANRQAQALANTIEFFS